MAFSGVRSVFAGAGDGPRHYTALSRAKVAEMRQPRGVRVSDVSAGTEHAEPQQVICP
jgi:hypothetical protein